MHPFLEHAWTKSCPQTGGRQTEGQRQQMDRQTDEQAETNIPQPLWGGGIICFEKNGIRRVLTPPVHCIADGNGQLYTYMYNVLHMINIF